MDIGKQINANSGDVKNIEFNNNTSESAEIVKAIESVVGTVDTIATYAEKIRQWNGEKKDKKRAKKFMDMAVDNHMKGNTTAEINCYLNAIRLFPDYAIAHNCLAWALALDEKQLDKALFHANRAVELAPENASYYDTLAEVYMHIGNNDQAETITIEAFNLSSKKDYATHYMCYHRLGRIKLLQNSPEEAIEFFNQSLKIGVSDSQYDIAHICYCLSIAHREIGNIPTAIEFANRAYELKPVKKLKELIESLSQ